jgi:YesN/AraC family two-component response regulator
MIMPEMTGVEAFNALKVIDPDVRVILISGFSFTEEANKIREAGAAGFLVKPVTAGTLLQTISDAIRTKRRGTAPILREGAARPERSQ